MEHGETPEQAALRELSEETGLSGRIDTLIGVTTSPGTLYPSVLLVAYLITNYSGTPQPGDDADDLVFFARHQLPDIAFDTHHSFIRLYYATLAPSAPLP